jgi:hypothetical protein
VVSEEDIQQNADLRFEQATHFSENILLPLKNGPLAPALSGEPDFTERHLAILKHYGY